MLTLLSNREIATAIWLGVLLTFGLSRETLYKASVRIFELSFRTKLLPFLLIGAVNLSVVIVALQRTGFWNVGQLKDILLWFAISGIAVMFGGVNQKRPTAAIKHAVIENFKIFALVEFFLSTYTLSLAGEIIMLPLLTFVVGLVTFSSAQAENATATKALIIIQGIMGLTLLLWAL